jgi:hypothetical protein
MLKTRPFCTRVAFWQGTARKAVKKLVEESAFERWVWDQVRARMREQIEQDSAVKPDVEATAVALLESIKTGRENGTHDNQCGKCH